MSTSRRCVVETTNGLSGDSIGWEVMESGKSVRPEFGGCFAFCLVREGLGVTCFHYIASVGGWWG